VTSLRVLLVINSLGGGGAEHSLAEMLEPLADAGIEPTVAVLAAAAEGSEAAVAASGTPLHVLGGGFPVGRLRRLVRSIRPHVVHTTLFEADVSGRLAAIATGTPVLTSLVNTTYDRARLADPDIRRPVLAAYRAVDGFTARRLTSHFHAITHAVKRSAVAALKLAPDAVTVIERGRDPARLGEPGADRRAAARRALGIGHELVLVSVGRQEYQKGHTVLLEALARLPSGVPPVILLQAGRRGRASEALEDGVRRLNGRHRVRLLGHRNDVPELLAAADLFVFPSRYEGLGGSLLEAMALGLPVVASALPAVGEVVEEGGNAVLVPPGDAAALAGALARLLEDDGLRRRLGQRSRAVFRVRFTLDRSVERMAELYAGVAAGRRRTRRGAGSDIQV